MNLTYSNPKNKNTPKLLKLIAVFQKCTLILLLTITNISYSNDFIQRLQLYISEINPDLTTSVLVKNSNKIPTICPFPLFTLTNLNKTWGNLNIQVICDDTKYFIPVYVEAIGEYLITTRDLIRGEILTSHDVERISGRIDEFYQMPISNKDILLNAEIVKNINAGSVIILSNIKRPWTVKAGDDINIIYIGNGFTVNNSGKAINNAHIGDKIRIRVGPREVIEATLTDKGRAVIYDNN